MECFYDTLYEVDCEGIDELRKVPCLYREKTYGASRREDGVWQMVATIMDPFFRNRLKWISQCGSIAHGFLSCFDNQSNNTSTFFFRVAGIYAPKRFVWGWGTDVYQLAKPICYYLGRYPNYWEYYNRKIVTADDWMTGAVSAMGTKPIMYEEESLKKSLELFERTGIYGEPTKEYIPSTQEKEIQEIAQKYGKESLNYYFNPETISKDFTKERIQEIESTGKQINDDLFHLSMFIKPGQLSPYTEQQFALQERTDRYNACKDSLYPPKVKVPIIKRVPPTPPKPYVPIVPPIPDAAPKPALGTGESRLQLLQTFEAIEKAAGWVIEKDKVIMDIDITWSEK